MSSESTLSLIHLKAELNGFRDMPSRWGKSKTSSRGSRYPMSVTHSTHLITGYPPVIYLPAPTRISKLPHSPFPTSLHLSLVFIFELEREESWLVDCNKLLLICLEPVVRDSCRTKWQLSQVRTDLLTYLDGFYANML